MLKTLWQFRPRWHVEAMLRDTPDALRAWRLRMLKRVRIAYLCMLCVSFANQGLYGWALHHGGRPWYSVALWCGMAVLVHGLLLVSFFERES